MDRLNTLRTVERPSSPNTALAAPDAVSIDAEVDRAVPVFDLSVEHLFEKAVSVWSDQKRVTCEYADTENQVAGFVAKTPFFSGALLEGGGRFCLLGGHGGDGREAEEAPGHRCRAAVASLGHRANSGF